MSHLFASVIPETGMTVTSFLACLVSAIVIGFGISWVYTLKSDYSKSQSIFVLDCLFQIPKGGD